MLPDLERKLLRILYNFYAQQRRMPNERELQVRTGRSKQEITNAFIHLEQQAYIRWDDKSSFMQAVILEGWERPEGNTQTKRPLPQRPSQDDEAYRYWTDY
ncbi:hypothetical protein [Paenibacillus massiliensis]|uniref:hypothetical protein n=1 Tax=Paenibacillus massiliensis TaxID=225917 RepID=UPI00035EF58C|nr:hypothetical protein [Paenibacillus massiliensis]